MRRSSDLRHCRLLGCRNIKFALTTATFNPRLQSINREIYFTPSRPTTSTLLKTLNFLNLCHHQPSSAAMAEIKIDKNLFQERLSHFVSAWKADKRAGDAIFNGASSILVLMGKSEETAQFHKNNAIHVRARGMRGAQENMLTRHLVLAAWLRIPCDSVSLHS